MSRKNNFPSIIILVMIIVVISAGAMFFSRSFERQEYGLASMSSGNTTFAQKHDAGTAFQMREWQKTAEAFCQGLYEAERVFFAHEGHYTESLDSLNENLDVGLVCPQPYQFLIHVYEGGMRFTATVSANFDDDKSYDDWTVTEYTGVLHDVDDIVE